MIVTKKMCPSCAGLGSLTEEVFSPSCPGCLGKGFTVGATYPDAPALIEEYLKGDECREYEPVGSRVTCDPPPTDTDEDWLVFPGDFRSFVRRAIGDGFDEEGSEILEDCPDDVPIFASLKLGRLNLIVSGEADFYRRFLAASSVAKRLNLLDKSDRIALFQAVLYGNACIVKVS